MNKKDFKSVFNNGTKFVPLNEVGKILDSLPSAAYTYSFNPMTQESIFEEFVPKSDDILDLPSPEYTKVVNEMSQFLSSPIKNKFLNTGFLYKRSALLHGLPGTGKTVIIQRIIKKVIENGGVVLFMDNPKIITKAFKILNDLSSNTLTLVIFEELDGLIEVFGDNAFLSILDGEIQKDNVMYLATTNYIDKIPKRLLRPGRFSSVIEVKYPTKEAREFYFKKKLGNFTDLELWVKKTEGFSVDELKEVIQSVYIFENNLDETVLRIRSTKDLGVEAEYDYDDYDDEVSLREKPAKLSSGFSLGLTKF